MLLASAEGEKEENEIFVLDTLIGESDRYLLIGGCFYWLLSEPTRLILVAWVAPLW